jgi:hypothetical protein
VPFEHVKVGDLLDLTLIPVFGRIALRDAVLLVGGGDSCDIKQRSISLGIGTLLSLRVAGLEDAEKSINW